MAAEIARREEEEHVWDQERLVAEARVQVEEEQHARKEERLAVERDLHKEEERLAVE